MRHHLALIAIATASMLLTPGRAGAVVFHDESANGDLSGDRLNPAVFVLAAGTNSLIATTVAGDLEYVRLTVPAGLALSQLILNSYAGLNQTAFVAVQSGAVFTEPPVGTNVANLLGWSHFGPAIAPVGTDYLPMLGGGKGAIGFTPPLPSGDYTWWLQQADGFSTTYRFDFVVVPSPSVGMVALVAAATVQRRRRLQGR